MIGSGGWAVCVCVYAKHLLNIFFLNNVQLIGFRSVLITYVLHYSKYIYTFTASARIKKKQIKFCLHRFKFWGMFFGFGGIWLSVDLWFSFVYSLCVLCIN